MSEISASDLYSSQHFELRVRQRKTKMFPDVTSIISIILTDKPVGISKQNETKFKIIYKLDDDYDLTVIISIRTLNPITFNLVTSIIENSSKRIREDNE